ncbi:MAG TPA: carboxymuconolactone decarboxylase family protein [Thermomicrobiales bacterium]
MQHPPLVPMVADRDASERVAGVFADIRETRQTDFINNFWRVVANDPAQLERTWAELKEVMAPGALDAMVKELIYIAVSTVNGCSYCIHSHTAAAKQQGATDAMLAELRAVVAAASKTNSIATGLQIPVDAEFIRE